MECETTPELAKCETELTVTVEHTRQISSGVIALAVILQCFPERHHDHNCKGTIRMGVTIDEVPAYPVQTLCLESDQKLKTRARHIHMMAMKLTDSMFDPPVA
jgi:hypothetical protein